MVYIKVLTPVITRNREYIITTSVPLKRKHLLARFFLVGLQSGEIADGEVGDIVLRVRRSGNTLDLLGITLNRQVVQTPKDYVTADEFFACVERCRGAPDGDACVKRCLGVVG